MRKWNLSGIREIWKAVTPKRLKKKTVIIGLSVAAVLVIGGGAWYYVGHNSSDPVYVYDFGMVGMTEYWGDTRKSSGPVSMDRIQTVFLSDTQTVTEILVEQGDMVKKGDLLMTFDTTLSDLAVERKRLEVEKTKLQLENANMRLWEINSMTPMEEPDPDEEIFAGSVLKSNYRVFGDKEHDGSKEESALICWLKDGVSLDNRLLDAIRKEAAIYRIPEEEKEAEEKKTASSASAFPEEDIVPLEEPEDSEESEYDIGYADGYEAGLADGKGSADTEQYEAGYTAGFAAGQAAGAEGTYEDGYNAGLAAGKEEASDDSYTAGYNAGFAAGQEEAGSDTYNDGYAAGLAVGREEGYEAGLEENTEEQYQDGYDAGYEAGFEAGRREQEEDPGEEPGEEKPGEEKPDPVRPDVNAVDHFYMILKSTQDNKSLGNRIAWQGVYVTCYKGAGGFTEYGFHFFDAAGMEDYSAADDMANMPEIDFGSGMSASDIAKLRAEQKKAIQELEFSLKMIQTEYNIMLAEVSDGNIYAQTDGRVASVLSEEEARESSQPILKVTDGGGYYVEGSVSELERDSLVIGQEVTVSDWSTGGSYTGTIAAVRDFPSGQNRYYGDNNPNASQYPFTVFVDDSADLRAGSYVSIQYSASSENGVYLENPFVRKEKGESFVYVLGADGRLEKRTVVTGKSLWGSYTEIRSGLTAEDKVAFPYGKNVKPGAKAQEGDYSTLYGY